MKKKRLLLISYANSIWTYRALRDIILPLGYEVVLFPIEPDDGKYADYFRENHITVYQDRHVLSPIISRIPRLRMWVRIWLNAKALSAYGPFDVVESSYLSQRDLALAGLLVKKYHSHWICDFWGSDLFRASKLALRRMKPYLKRCQYLRVHNIRGKEIICKAYGNDVADKTHLALWGLEGFERIDAAREQYGPTGCRARFGIDPDRFVVCVGYNASSAQRQQDVLHALAKLPQERLQRMALILPQTYCEDDAAYSVQAAAFAKTLPCQVVVLRDFLNAEEMAMLELSCNVFIHSIKTDSFAASLQEFMYSGTTVIQGSWLIYPQFDDLNITPITFDRFDELPGLITDAMDGRLPLLTVEERNRFPEHYSWDAVFDSWAKLYI